MAVQTGKTSTDQRTSSKSTRDQLIEVSAGLLCTRGFSGFSYQDLANELGIRKASVHHHFAQKNDLGLALCDWTEQWLLQGFAHFDQQGTNATDKLQRYLRAAAEHTFNEHKQCPVSALYSDLAVLPEAIQARMQELTAIEHQWVSGVFYAGLQSGELTSQQSCPLSGLSDSAIKSAADDMARLFVFSCKGALFYARLQGEEFFYQSMDLLMQQWRPLKSARRQEQS